MITRDTHTIDYYDDNAQMFVAATLDADMGDSLRRFAALLPAAAHVLDWGCGSGRDSRALRELGFDVTSVDASRAMAAEALAATGTIVRVESFDELWETDTYDGVWACSSLLHVRPAQLPGVFARAHAALKEGGVLYCSFKYGTFAGYRGGRWFTDLDEEALRILMEPLFGPIGMWVTEDVRPGRSELWLNCLASKR